MRSSVLRSEHAVLVNIEIMRAFVRLRQLLATHKDLAKKLEELEKKYDGQFKIVFEAIRKLMTPAAPTVPRMGFHDQQGAGSIGKRGFPVQRRSPQTTG